MRRCVALLAVVLVSPASAAGQAALRPPRRRRRHPPIPPTAERVKRTRRSLERADYDPRRRAGAPDARLPRQRDREHRHLEVLGRRPPAVSAMVRPSGGTWHHEFQDMVTPDEFKGYGGILSNGEKLQLAATSLAFAGAMQLLGIGVRQAKEALRRAGAAQGQGRSAAGARGVLPPAPRSAAAGDAPCAGALIAPSRAPARSAARRKQRAAASRRRGAPSRARECRPPLTSR